MLAAAGAPAQWGDAGPALVFFDWGKSELSGDAKTSLDKVAELYRQAPRAMTVDGQHQRKSCRPASLHRIALRSQHPPRNRGLGRDQAMAA